MHDAPDPASLTADAILAATDPAAVFGTEVARGFKQLARRWHPDLCKDPRARDVLAHLVDLRDLGTGVAGREIAIPAGTITWYSNRVALRSDWVNGAYATMLARIAEVHGHLDKRVPKVKAANAGEVSYERPPGAVPFLDVFKKYPDGVPSVHVAWMANRLYELGAHLYDRCEQVHGGILPESLLLLPEPHGLISLDWRFVVPVGDRVKHLPDALVPFVAPDRKATSAIDIGAAHRIAIMLLGDPSGVGNVLLRRKDIDRRFLDWFRSTPGSDPIASYRKYRRLLEEVFGPRKYHPFAL